MVRRVLVDYNSPVTVGQVLAELDTDKLKATVKAARAKVAAAKANVVEAEAAVREKVRDYRHRRCRPWRGETADTRGRAAAPCRRAA